MSEKKQRELRVRCLVLDHDDTVVKSTPEINFPAILRSLKDLRGTTMSYEQFVEYNLIRDFMRCARTFALYAGGDQVSGGRVGTCGGSDNPGCL